MKKGAGFTIVELLVVIVVIGILATVTIVVYSGTSQRAIYAAMQLDLSNAYKQLELFKVENGYYPTTIDCSIPDGISNKCIKFNSSTTVYKYIAGGSSSQQFMIQSVNGTQTVSISQNGSVLNGNFNLLTGDTSVSKTSSNEFVQYYDLAPIFDKYGYGSNNKYTISFDIKSANISNKNTVNVYMQNGSGARYSFNATVPVTTAFVRKSVTIVPSLANNSMVLSMLAFYGTYGTGNIVTVKNVKVEFGSIATDWSQSPL